MKKTVLLILMVFALLPVACGNKKEKKSIENRYGENPEDCGCVVGFYENSFTEDTAMKGKADIKKTINLEGIDAHEIKQALQGVSWLDDAVVNRNMYWIDLELQFKDSEDKYYISFTRAVIHQIPGEGTFIGSISAELLDKIMKLYPERINDYKLDENGLLTRDETIEYALNILRTRIKGGAFSSMTNGFSGDDDQDSYEINVTAGREECVSNVKIEKAGTPRNYFYIDIDRKKISVCSEADRAEICDKQELPDKLSYEGLEIQKKYAVSCIVTYTDGHYDYYIDDVTGNINSIRYTDGYRPEPVDDILDDAWKYYTRLYPESADKGDEWIISDHDMGDGSKEVYYKKEINGRDEILASFLYDKDNRLLTAGIR